MKPEKTRAKSIRFDVDFWEEIKERARVEGVDAATFVRMSVKAMMRTKPREVRNHGNDAS